jgi:hypothetical protein
LKNLPTRICITAIYILGVISIPVLSANITSSLFKQSWVVPASTISNADALPLNLKDQTKDLSSSSDTIFGNGFNRAEKNELFDKSSSLPSFALPSIDSRALDIDDSLSQSDLDGHSAGKIRGNGDQIPNQYIVVLKNESPFALAEAASDARRGGGSDFESL